MGNFNRGDKFSGKKRFGGDRGFGQGDRSERPTMHRCQSLEILYYYLANYLGKFLIKSNVYFLGECKSILV